MILVLTNSKDATADYLCNLLSNRGGNFLRINTDTIARSVRLRYAKDIELWQNGRPISPKDISAVWLRRPEPIVCGPASSPESGHCSEEWAEALEGFLAPIPFERWVNHPTANARAGHKIDQLAQARQLGLSVPKTIVTQDADELRAFYEQCQRRIIVKPLSSGYIERLSARDDTLIYTNRVGRSQLTRRQLLGRCPTLFQEEIVKSTDVRVCIIDGKFYSVALAATDEHGAQRVDVRRNNMRDVDYKALTLPARIKRLTKTLVESYRLRFAAVDYVVDMNGDWFFLEINPNGQWAWLDLEAGTSIGKGLISAFGHG